MKPWHYISTLGAILTGIIAQIVFGVKGYSFVAGLLVFLFMIFNNPEFRYFKAFTSLTVMIFVLNRFAFQFINKQINKDEITDYTELKITDPDIIVTICLSVLALFCLYLDFRLRGPSGESNPQVNTLSYLTSDILGRDPSNDLKKEISELNRLYNSSSDINESNSVQDIRGNLISLRNTLSKSQFDELRLSILNIIKNHGKLKGRTYMISENKLNNLINKIYETTENYF